MNSTNTPKVFFSYSWSPRTSQELVIELAKRLQSDGIHVIIDVWDLAEGQDKNVFMEQMVSNPEVKKVLIFCTKSYTEKANSRQGGVGTESIIISEEVYSHTNQEKFIPIVFEKDESNHSYKPAFIKSRIHIDLTPGDEYENNYEKLIRNIFGKPEHKRPPIGSPPTHLWSEEPQSVRTSKKVDQIKNAILQDKKSVSYLIQNYYETFLLALVDDYNLDHANVDPNKYDEPVVEMIGKTIELRNDFIDFIKTLIKYKHFNTEEYCKFLEELISKFIEGKQQFHSENIPNEHKRFLVYELFLYTNALLFDHEQFIAVKLITSYSFFVTNEKDHKVEIFQFPIICFYSKLLNEYRNRRLALQRINVSVDFIHNRAQLKEIPFVKLKEVDIILYYIYLIKGHKDKNYSTGYRWFPMLSAYWFNRLSYMERAKSKRYLEKILPIFDCETLEDLKKTIVDAGLNSNDNRNFDYNVPNIYEGLNIEQLGTFA